ncbi:MAG: DUF58 domain-containing protein [Armatimonadota bacterium]
MWTKKAKLLAFGAVMAYFIALINDSLVLHAVSGSLIGLLGICYLLAQRSLRGIEARRVLLTHRLVEGGHLAVRVEVSNAGRAGRWRILLDDRMENLTNGDGKVISHTFIAPHIAAGERTVGRGEYACPLRGRYRLGPLLLRGSDPLGVFEVRREIRDEAWAIVYPETFRFPLGLVRGSAFLRMHDARRSAARGHGLEFFGVREYVPGDDLRHVHWKVTAHVGRLSLKEFESGASVSLTLLLDLQADRHVGSEPDSTLHYAVRLASSAAREAVLQGGFVRLVASAGTPPKMPTERGDAHLHRILEFLAEARADGRVSFAEFVRAEASTASPGADVLLITPSADSRLTANVAALCERGVHVVVILIDAASFPRTDEPLAPGRGGAIFRALRLLGFVDEDGPPRIVRQERTGEEYDALAQDLTGVGARVAVVRHGERLDRAVARSLRKARSRTHAR